MPQKNSYSNNGPRTRQYKSREINGCIIPSRKRKMAQKISSDSEDDYEESKIESSHVSTDHTCIGEPADAEEISDFGERETSNTSSNIDQVEVNSVELFKSEPLAVKTTEPVNSYSVTGLASDSQLEGTDLEESFQAPVDISETVDIVENITKSLSDIKINYQSFVAEEPMKNKSLNWAAIKKATEDVEPTCLGNQGIATFNRQKALTIECMHDLHDSLADCPPENARVNPPQALVISLMDHQIYALAWMLWREKRKPRGGILADDMGLGKTLSMISLILMTQELENEKNDKNDKTVDKTETDDDNYKRKKTSRKDKYDGGTLVVCPASLVNQWNEEINKQVKKDNLETCIHHGRKRGKEARTLAKYDVVITTYAIVSQEHKEKTTVFGIRWNRVILDEAHVTRNYRSKMSEAVCDLSAENRWAITGTPIQNKSMDVFALLKFLKCSPFDDLTIYKKWINNDKFGGHTRLNTVMQSIFLRRTKLQLQQKGALSSLPQKEIVLIELDLSTPEMNVYQSLMLYSKSIFAQYLRQKQKRDVNYYNNFPTKSSDIELTYSKIHKKLSKMHGGTTDGRINIATILTLLLRLRQICCHPGLIHNMLVAEENADVCCDFDAVNLNIVEEMNKIIRNDNSPDVDVTVNEDISEANIAKASVKIMLPSNPVFNLDRLSTKISKIISLIEEKIQYTNDKAIIVSQWTSFLKIIARRLDFLRISYNQLDGTVSVNKRDELVTEFNEAQSGPKIMLLSLTAGGVGLNLIGANYLFLTDLHWNPQLEAQAQDRIYRVGQKKPVTIYKFMCKDTVEEKVKSLQDKKLAIASSVLDGAQNSDSKLTLEDLRTIFDL